MPTTGRQDIARRKTLRRTPRIRPSISPSRPKRLGVGESYVAHAPSTRLGKRDIQRADVQHAKYNRIARGPGGPTRDSYPAEVKYKEGKIVRGQARPTKPTSNDPAEIRRFNREKRIYGRGKNARAMLQLKVGDPHLTALKDVPSHIVRDSAIAHINQSIAHVDKQIKTRNRPDSKYPALDATHLKELQGIKSQLEAHRSDLKTRRIIGAEKRVKHALGTQNLSRAQREGLVQLKGRLRKRELKARARTGRLTTKKEHKVKRGQDAAKLAAQVRSYASEGDQGDTSSGGVPNASDLVKSTVIDTAKGLGKTAEETLANLPSSFKQAGSNPLAAIGLATAKTAYQDPGNTALTAATVLPVGDIAATGGRMLVKPVGRLVARRLARTLPARAGSAIGGAVSRASLRRATLAAAEENVGKAVTKDVGKAAAREPVLVSGTGEAPTRRLTESVRRPTRVAEGSTTRTPLARGGKVSAEGETKFREADLNRKAKEIQDFEATMKSRFETRPYANPHAKGGMTQKLNKLQSDYIHMASNMATKTNRFLKAPTEAVYEASKQTITGVPLRIQAYKWPLVAIAATGAPTVAYDASVKKGHEIERTYRDARDLMTGFPYAIYLSSKAGVELAKGNPTLVEDIYNSLKNTDPVALALQGRFDEALKSAKARPFSAALSVTGWGSLVGRGLGGSARVIGGLSGYAPGEFTAEQIAAMGDIGPIRQAGRKLGAVGTRYREPIHLVGTKEGGGAVRNVRYSPNLFVKGAQKLSDRRIKNNWTSKQQVAYRQLLATHDLHNSFAMFDLSSRQKTGEAEQAVVDIFNTLSGKKSVRKRDFNIKGSVPGGHDAMSLIAQRLLRSPATANEDLQALLERVREIRRTTKNHTANAQQDILIQNLEGLQKANIVSDQRIWDAVDAFKKGESVRQENLVKAGLLSQEQADMAPYIGYMTHHMGATMKMEKNVPVWYMPKAEGKDVVGIGGEPGRLTLEKVKAHAAQHGVEGEPVHISARLADASGEGDITVEAYVHDLASTGQLIRQGRFDTTGETLIRQAVRGQRNLDKANFMQHLIDRYGVGSQSGKPFPSISSAIKYYEERSKNFESKMVPMKVRTTQATADKALLDTHPFNDVHDQILQSLGSGKYADTFKLAGEGKVVLIPEYVAKEIQGFVDSQKGMSEVMRRVNREFKGSVLPFSPKWHIGNLVDMGLRMFMEGVTPLDWERGIRLAKAIKAHDETHGTNLYADFMAQMGGGHLSTARRSVVDRGATPYYQIRQMDAAHAMLNYMPIFGKTLPGIAGRIYRDAQKGSFKLSHIPEFNARLATAGKHSRVLLDNMGNNYFRSMVYSKNVVEDIVQGLTDTNNMKQLGKAVEDTLGDYTNMSPAFRSLVNTWMPFGLWARASAKWVLTLPYKHPIKTAFFSSVNRMDAKERAQFGLFVDKKTQTVLPGFMQGSIPSYIDPKANTAWVYRTQQYTSFGPWYNFIDSGLSFVAPEISQEYNIFRGYDWTGQQIINKDGSPLTQSQTIGLSMSALMETMFYPANLAHRILVHGSPSNRSAILAEVPGYRNLFHLSKPERKWYKASKYSKPVTDPADSLTDIASRWGNPLARTSFTLPSNATARTGPHAANISGSALLPPDVNAPSRSTHTSRTHGSSLLPPTFHPHYKGATKSHSKQSQLLPPGV